VQAGARLQTCLCYQREHSPHTRSAGGQHGEGCGKAAGSPARLPAPEGLGNLADP